MKTLELHFPQLMPAVLRPYVICLLLLLSYNLSGCSSDDSSRANSIRVAAAANLTSVLPRLIAKYQEAKPGVVIEVAYGSSQKLYLQLNDRASFDLFLSADSTHPQLLADDELTTDSPQVYCRGRLAVWVTPQLNLNLDSQGLDSLLDDRVRRIAIGSPQLAPYGAAAKTAMERAGIHEEVQDRLVFGNNVAAAAQYAHTGTAEAAFLPLSLTQSDALSAGQIWEVPAEMYPPLHQAAVVMNHSSAREQAEAFLDFLLSPAAQDMLRDAGYQPVQSLSLETSGGQ